MEKDFSEYSIKDVLNAIDNVYKAIDSSMDNGYIARVAERRDWNVEHAADMVFESDGYELITEDLVEEAAELVKALYYLRSYGKMLAYPMPARDTPNESQGEFYKEFVKQLKEKLNS